jgi:hypothetical protein
MYYGMITISINAPQIYRRPKYASLQAVSGESCPAWLTDRVQVPVTIKLRKVDPAHMV